MIYRNMHHAEARAPFLDSGFQRAPETCSLGPCFLRRSQISIFYTILLTGTKMLFLQQLQVLSLKRFSNNKEWSGEVMPGPQREHDLLGKQALRRDGRQGSRFRVCNNDYYQEIITFNSNSNSNSNSNNNSNSNSNSNSKFS